MKEMCGPNKELILSLTGKKKKEKHSIYVYYHLYKLNRIELFHQICLEAFSMKIAEFFKTCIV